MDEYSEDLVKSIGSEEVSKLAQDFAIEGSDTLIDAVINNEITKQVPVLKTLVGVTKGVLALRDRNYIRKIIKFLFQTDQVSAEIKAEYVVKLELNREEMKRAGEAVLEILDSISTSEKAPMVGKIFSAYSARIWPKKLT